VHVRVSVYGRCGRPWARESRPEVLRWDANRSGVRRVLSGVSVLEYGRPKVGRSAPSYVGRRVGRSSAVTEIVTNLKQDRPKQNRWMERQRRYLSFPYSTPPRIAKLGPGERSARVGRMSCGAGRAPSLEPWWRKTLRDLSWPEQWSGTVSNSWEQCWGASC
jgi:hypothetical protein